MENLKEDMTCHIEALRGADFGECSISFVVVSHPIPTCLYIISVHYLFNKVGIRIISTVVWNGEGWHVFFLLGIA